MKQSGEIDPLGVLALLSGASCAPAHSAATADRDGQPAPADRGSGDLPTVFVSLDEARTAIERAASSAQRMLTIFTPDLEPELYDQSAFLDLVKRFVLSRSFSRVRVLLADPSRLVRDGNRFVAMSRRLSSCIEIRHAGAPVAQRACAFLVADDRAIVYRLRADTWDGIADFNNPPVARLYLTEFDRLWSESSPEDALRIARAGT